MAALSNPAPPPPSSASARVSSENVERAVKGLLSWRNSKAQTEKPQLLEEDEFVYLILTLKKIPPTDRTNPYKIPLPNSLHAADSNELCLIFDDRPKSNLSKDDVKKKIKAENIPVSKVIKLTKLRTDYRPFEAKRKLCDSYDMFFADKRIVPLLPKLIGKHFFKKKKIPVPVNLSHKNWKEQIERACGSAMLYLKTGTCSVLRVARVSMGEEEIVENVMAAIEGVAEIVPRKWGNVRSFHVKLLESLALPVYQTVPDVKLKIEGLKNKEEEEKEAVEKSEDEKDSNKKKKKTSKKGRIHEVRYMDTDIGEVVDEDELGGGDDDDLEMNDAKNDEMGSGGKKRKKAGKVKGKRETGEDSPKKVAKAKKDVLENGENLPKKVADKVKKDGVKPKKGGLAVEESCGKKEKKKSSIGKSKNVEMKIKDKKTKKSLAA